MSRKREVLEVVTQADTVPLGQGLAGSLAARAVCSKIPELILGQELFLSVMLHWQNVDRSGHEYWKAVPGSRPRLE